MGYLPPTDLAAWLPCRLQHAGAKTMWSVVKQWCPHLMWDSQMGTCQACIVCAQEYPQGGQVMQGCIPLTPRQVDYIGPLLKSEGVIFALTAVDTATCLFFYLAPWSRKSVCYDLHPDGADSLVQPAHHSRKRPRDSFYSQDVQRCATQLRIQWKPHVPCHPRAAGKTEQYDGPPKQGLGTAANPPSMKGWAQRLRVVMRAQNERPR